MKTKCGNCDRKGCKAFFGEGQPVIKCLVCDGTGLTIVPRPTYNELVSAFIRLVNASKLVEMGAHICILTPNRKDAETLLARLK